MLVYQSLLQYSKYVDRYNNHHCHEKPLLYNAHERKKHQKTPPTKTLKWYNLTLRSKVPASTCRNLPHKLSERLISLGALRLPDCFGTSNFHRPRKFMRKQIKRPKKTNSPGIGWATHPKQKKTNTVNISQRIDFDVFLGGSGWFSVACFATIHDRSILNRPYAKKNAILEPLALLIWWKKGLLFPSPRL